jgi:hypothetical protein
MEQKLVIDTPARKLNFKSAVFKRFIVVLLAGTVLALLGLTLSLQTLGWDLTWYLIDFLARLSIAGLPVLIGLAILIRTRLRFSLRTLFAILLLAALFVAMNLMPLVRFRNERYANAKMHASNPQFKYHNQRQWDLIYQWMKADALPEVPTPPPTILPRHLRLFALPRDKLIPRDCDLASLWLNSDEQCRVLAENWARFSNLRVVTITRTISEEGFELLRETLPKIESLDIVVTNDVDIPKGWYQSLGNIRILYAWGEVASRGTQFDKEHLKDIAKLPKLQLLMVLGFAFDDSDAEALVSSESIQHVILSGTAVTAQGEAVLTENNIRVSRS